MSDKEFNPWATGTGLPDAFTGPIKEAYFGYNDDYQNGDVCVLMVDVVATDPEIGNDGVVSMLYPCGKGWEPSNKGQSCVHESGKPKIFTGNSGMGILVDAALEVSGEALVERGVPTDAATWIGLNYDWERKEYSGTFSGEKSTWTRLIPVAEAEGGSIKPVSAKAKGAVKKAAATSSPEAEAEAEAEEGEVKLPFKIKAALKKIATENPDHDTFMEVAYEAATEMDGWDEKYEDFITDSGEGSLWQEAQS